MIAEDQDWYRGRRVLVTGHTGFKGAWLSLWLQTMGAEVTGFALAPATPSLYELVGTGARMTSIIGDVRDRDAVRRAVDVSRPEVVFHLAAQPLVRASYADPIRTFDVNVLGTANLLDALRAESFTKAIVVVTSDKCYENAAGSQPFREGDPMGGSDPYSASKGCAELVTASFARSYFSSGAVAVATVRAGNVLGGGDWGRDRLVPDLMRAAANGARADIRRPKAIRPWQHVLEPLRGYLMLARRLVVEGRTLAGGWNFGPSLDDAVSVERLVLELQKHWTAIAVESAIGGDTLHEAEELRLDCAKARVHLGWVPHLDVRQAAALTVEWYRRVHEDPECARQVTLEQLERYSRFPERNS